MTDDLRSLAQPLLDDPPHPAPPLDELRARVDRRRARRARAIGAASVALVVLVVAVVAALPRDGQLDVAGDPTTTTTQPPPPFTPGPVQLVVTPASAPLAAERTIEFRNDAATTWFICGGLDLYRWDGGRWTPVAMVFPDASGTVLATVDPWPAARDCTPSPVVPGTQITVPFDLGGATWQAVDGTTPPRHDPLPTGAYELREPTLGRYTDADPLPLGRFQITDDPPTTEPPPLSPEAVVLAVSPASAPLTQDRTLEVHNTSDRDYADCALRFDLARWDGTTWVPVAILVADSDPPYLDEVGRAPTDGQCQSLSTVPAGAAANLPLDLAALARYEHGGTVPADRRPLAPGWYELRSPASAEQDGSPRAAGRFEVTDASAPTPITVAPESAPLSGSTVVDLYPLDGDQALIPDGERLPSELVVLDDTTISIGWTDWCNLPADHLTVTATDTEIEVRLAVGWYGVLDCVGEPDHWAVTATLPGRIDGRPIVVRAEGADGELRAGPALLPGAWEEPLPPGVVSVSLLVDEPGDGTVRFRPAYDIVYGSPSTCRSTASTHRSDLTGPVVFPRLDVSVGGVALTGPCRDATFSSTLPPDGRVIGG